MIEGTIEILDSLETYIWPMIAAIGWNFYATFKLWRTVYGDDDDPTNEGLAARVEDLDDGN